MAKMNSTLTQERLKELLVYNPETGVFTNRVTRSSGSKAGTIAGCLENTGYCRLSINYKRYQLHQLAFLYMKGYFPEQVDHINHIRTDNRWSNLREASNIINCRNRKLSPRNTSGFTGVSFDIQRNRWIPRITINGKFKKLGRFKTHYAACYARHAANIKHGYHENHGGL